MKITKILTVSIVCTLFMSCGISISSEGNSFKEVTTLENQLDSVSYAVGLNFASSLKLNFDEVNRDVFIQAIVDGLDSLKPKIDPKQARNIMTPYFQKKNKEKAAKRQQQAKEREEKLKKEAEVKFADNKKAGEEFLAKNKSKKGVITTPSGLQYQVIKKGKGDLIKPTDRIKIHYHGTTIDGTVFDSTVEKNKPYESTANIFVPGFNEGLSLMKKGSKHKFFIPQELAYKYSQRNPKIPTFSTLIFEVEILDIIKK